MDKGTVSENGLPDGGLRQAVIDAVDALQDANVALRRANAELATSRAALREREERLRLILASATDYAIFEFGEPAAGTEPVRRDLTAAALGRQLRDSLER